MCVVEVVAVAVGKVGLQLSKEWLQHQWTVVFLAVCPERLWFGSEKCLSGYSEDLHHRLSTAGQHMWSDFYLHTLLYAGCSRDQTGCKQVDVGYGSTAKPVAQCGLM